MRRFSVRAGIRVVALCVFTCLTACEGGQLSALCQARCADEGGGSSGGNTTTIHNIRDQSQAEAECSEASFSQGTGCPTGFHFDGCSCEAAMKPRLVDLFMPVPVE